MESTIGLYKSELIHFDEAGWDDEMEVEFATADWVRWYNSERLHSSVGYVPPVECRSEFVGSDNVATVVVA
ncbi:integrase core domain-containing protein [Corynebacterium uterequi]|uniref:integrase core domain-containing protein n=1 Tax=Corynebacterium uterequi TaxID=1072256 RepID=UPI0009E333B1